MVFFKIYDWEKEIKAALFSGRLFWLWITLTIADIIMLAYYPYDFEFFSNKIWLFIFSLVIYAGLAVQNLFFPRYYKTEHFHQWLKEHLIDNNFPWDQSVKIPMEDLLKKLLFMILFG